MRSRAATIGWALALASTVAPWLVGCSPSGSARAPVAGPVGSGPPVIPATSNEVLALTRRDAPATLVNVWATWCAPCKEEFPELLKVTRARESDGVRLVLVSADFADQLPAVRRFLEAQGVTDTTYLKSGDDMAFIDALSPRWSGALPATFVYDRHGELVTFWEGRANASRFDGSIDSALGRGADEEEVKP